MVQSAAKTVAKYLQELPPDRRAAIARVRDVINANLPDGFQEGMHGMIVWSVPLSRFPETYNGDPLWLAGLASQKQNMALYLNGVYSDPALDTWFRAAWQDAGKKLDMGKSCVRFRSLDAIPLDVVAETIAKISVDRLIELYVNARVSANRATTKKKPAAKKKPAPKKKPAATKKPTATKKRR